MIVLDTTIVNVALPSIRTDLRFTETSLVWVVNAYMLTFGGFLLLGGRLGDLYGHRKLFRLRNLTTANIIGVLWAAAMFAWFFITTLYLQAVLGFTPLQIGLAFLPANLIMAAFSLGLSAKIVMRFGIRGPLGTGLMFGAVGLALLARAPVGANVAVDVLPSMTLLGLAAGIAFNPLLIAAMNDVKPTESGLASGVVNTAFMMGGSLGLAVLASLAAGRTQHLLASGTAMREALNGGYHAAFVVGAIFAGISALLGATLIRMDVHAQSQGSGGTEVATD